MSANNSNRAVNSRRRQRPARHTAKSVADANKVVLSSVPNINSFSADRTFRFRRNLADCMVSLPSGILPTAQFMPGFSGTSWVALGAPISDLSPNPATGYLAQPFCLFFSLDSLVATSDIVSMFAEYRVVAVKFTIKTLNGAAGLQNLGGVVPEVWLSAWPDDNTPPSSIVVQEQRVNVKKCLTGNSTLTMTIAPRPAIQFYQSATSTGYGYSSDQILWGSTANGLSMPWYAASGMIRNFPSVASSGFNVRFEAEAFIELRRLR